MKLFQKFLLDGEERGDKQARNQNLFLPRRPVINLIWLTSNKAKYLQMHTVNILNQLVLGSETRNNT
jgi:hypothetical protein